LLAQAVDRSLAQIEAINQDATFVRLMQAQEQVGKGRLTRAAALDSATVCPAVISILMFCSAFLSSRVDSGR
jgi:hypothetical protein